MLDTVSLKFQVSPTSEQLAEWYETTSRSPTGLIKKKYIKHTKLDEIVPIYFTYYPQNPGFPRSQCLVEFSIPKVLYGNNVMLIRGVDEIYEAASIVNDFISELSWMRPINVVDGILSRIDLTYDHHVGNFVQDYIGALMKADYPRRKTIGYLNEGVQFWCRTTSTKFYDKGREQIIPADGNIPLEQKFTADGNLRQETTIRNSYQISRKLGVDSPTLLYITPGWVIEILQRDLASLHINNSIICTPDLALQKLMNNYSQNTAFRLFGYLQARQSMTNKQMIANGNNERTLRRWKKQIKDAGVSLLLSDNKFPLLPLCVELETDINVLEVVSDTKTWVANKS